MKELKFIIHAGRGKTGTTYIQANAQNLKDVIFVGKYYECQTRFLGEINKIHYELFPSYRNEVLSGFDNPTKNSYELINRYVDEIIKLIFKKPNINSIILSDECISDYQNYLGELNSFLLIFLGNTLKEKLKEKYEVKNYFSLTIRNQADLLLSSFAYCPLNETSFNIFIKRILSRPYHLIGGGLFYYKCYCMYKSLAGDDWDIIFTPFEILEKDKDPISFLKSSLVLSEKEISSLDKRLINKKINSNSTSLKKIKITRKSTRSRLLFKLGRKMQNANVHAIKRTRDEKRYTYFYYFSIFLMGKVLEKIDFYLNKLLPSRKGKQIIYTDEQLKLIKKTYLNDNSNLQLILKEYDLKKYGYL